jgi:hypothetical protein
MELPEPVEGDGLQLGLQVLRLRAVAIFEEVESRIACCIASLLASSTISC